MALASQAKAVPKGDLHPMAKIIPITEHFQHFVRELQDSFWGDLQGEAQGAAKRFFERLSEQQRDRYMVSARYGRSAARNGTRRLPGA